MDRKHSRRGGGHDSESLKAENVTNNADVGRRLAGGEQVGQLRALRDLGNQLQIRAERMRLLARAEEGLGEAGFNPYSTTTISPGMERSDAPVILPESVPQEGRSKEQEPIEMHSKKTSKTTNAPKGKQPLSQLPGDTNENPGSSKIPVASARQRRRAKKSKTKPGRVSGVNIHEYRPGYTWNRGGRLKELRIRNLARKFSTNWKRKVFGRVMPSQARHHYETALLKVTFGVWYDMWWEARKEWRLMIRAECHHRYVLWLKTFRAWRDFVIKRRVYNTKMALAHQHGSCRLMRKCLVSWIAYTDMRRDKKRKVVAANNFCYMRTLRLAWGCWMEQHDQVHHRQHMKTVALQFWAYRVQAQHWLMWQERLSCRRSAVVNQYRAARHYSARIVRKCFQGLLVYWARRRQKAREKDYGMYLYEKSLQEKMWRQWCAAHRLRLAEHAHRDHMAALARSFTMRRAFTHWRHYIVLVHEKHEMIADAESHYIRQLMAAGLSAFRLNVVQIHIKAMRNKLAEQFRHKQLQLWAWNHWLDRCDNNDELRIISKTRRARKHYQITLLTKGLAQLQQYCFWRQHRKAQYARADAHYYMHTVPEYLFRMRIFVQLMKNNRENRENGLTCRRENLQARFFYNWYSSFQFSKEYRMNERMAILHHEESSLRSYFHRWRGETTLALRGKDNEEVASELYCTSLCRSHLRAWKAYVDDLRRRQIDEIKASRHYCARKMKVCLVAWRKYTGERKKKQEKTTKARAHYHRKLSRRMLSMWLHYVDMQRLVKQRTEVKYAVKCQLILRNAFNTWRENVTAQIVERHTDGRADVHHALHIMSKIMTAWHRYAAIHAYKKQETRQWVHSATQHLNRVKLSIYFHKWCQYHEERLSERAKCMMADQHRAAIVKVKVMDVWKTYTKDSIQKSLLRKQSDWFCSVRLTARHFIVWKQAHKDAQALADKANIALWHWCLNLHRKVLIGWYSYVQQRKHKKARISAAMERRRHRLLKDGVTQWLTVAGDMSAMRARFAAQQQAKSAYDTYQLVLRCGVHWKHWAANRRQARGGPPFPHTQPGKSTTPRAHTSTPRDADIRHVVARHDVIAKHDPTARAPSPKIPNSVNPVLAISAVREVIQPVRSVNAPEIHSHPQLRARPRRPDFLIESLKRAGLYSSSMYGQSPSPQIAGTESHIQVPAESEKTVDADHFQVERLNLSNISENKSELDSQLKVTFEKNRSDLQYGTSDHNAHDLSNTSRGPAPIDSDRSREPSHNKSLPSDISDTYNIQVKTQKHMSSKPVPPFVKLMTPADFLGKTPDLKICDGKTINTYPPFSSAVPNLKDNNVINDTSVCSEKLTKKLGMLTENYNIHSEPQSVVSTPRVLCQSSEHFHPLSQTYSSTGEFPRWVTPQTFSDTPRLMEEKTVNQPTKQDIQADIVKIRNELKMFEQKKKKLRTMQKQLKQLSDWLRGQEVEGQGSEDEDVQNTRREVTELSSDVTALKATVDYEKVRCSQLIDRVKLLVAQLSS